MIEILSHGKSPSEAKAKCLVTEILFTDENILANTIIHILNIIDVGVEKHKADKEKV